jgi:hypothetical protein
VTTPPPAADGHVRVEVMTDEHAAGVVEHSVYVHPDPPRSGAPLKTR